MAELNLELYQSVEDFDRAVNELKTKAYNEKEANKYKSIIEDLKERENEVYRTLGNGNISDGKKAMEQFANIFYINNEITNNIIQIANNLFMPSYFEGENYYELRKKGGKYGIKMNESAQNIKNFDEAESLFLKYCEHWNKSVSQYDKLLEDIKNSMYKDGFISQKTLDTIENSLSVISETLNKVIEGKITLNNLPEKFIEEKGRIAGIFGNLIGKITEGAKLDFENFSIQEINKNLKNGKEENGIIFEHGDTIGQGSPGEHERITGFATEAKADGVFTLNGELHSPKAITIPTTLKYTSENRIKTHSGSLNSIADIIFKESSEYSKDFKELATNMVYWIHFSEKESSEIILILKKILNKFAYAFIHGPSNYNPYGNALFFIGFFKNVSSKNSYENYFTPVSKILEIISSYIEGNDFVVDWAGFSLLDNFILKNKLDKENNNYLELGKEKDIKLRNIKKHDKFGDSSQGILKDNVYNKIREAIKKERAGLVIDSVEKFYTDISSKIGTKPMTYPRGIITGEEGAAFSIFDFKKHGIIL